MLYGCDDAADLSDVCGDGILGEHEVCDGTNFRAGLTAYCPNGSVARVEDLRCTQTCTLDMAQACDAGAVCGNGIVEGDEECDGRAPTITAGCEHPDLSKLKCTSCKVVDEGVCASAAPKTCGNGQLDDGEVCDATIIPQALRRCPEGYQMLENPRFVCLDSCQSVDTSRACVRPDTCGNGALDAGEPCDGALLDPEAVSGAQCDPGKTLDPSKVTCSTACALDLSQACSVKPYEGVMFSEVVPQGDISGVTAVAFELANRGQARVDLSGCSLAVFSESRIEARFALAELGVTALDGKKVAVICSQSGTQDKFGDTCDAILSQNEIVTAMNAIGNAGLVGLTCGNDAVVDFVNWNSMYQAMNYGHATDFIRQCSAQPHTVASDAKMGDGWTVTADEVGAPAYQLGEHCNIENTDIASCAYSISRDTLTNRSQTVELALELSIPGITDKTDKTDVSKNISIEFVSGLVKNDAVSKQINHYVKPTADESWTNASGVDRYIGTLHNWDMYEGFWYSEAGVYTLDAQISFDNGVTYYTCGPRGLVQNYDVYRADERATLTVNYAQPPVSNDGTITDSEVCDGTQFIPELLVCSKKDEVITDPSAMKCYGDWADVDRACGKAPATCGNGTLDSGELCDGTNLPDTAKVCVAGEVVVDNPKWTCSETCTYVDRSHACETACGNGRLDANVQGAPAEVCDGTLIPDTAKVCPAGQTLKQDAVFQCNATCSGIDTELACEPTCGNKRIDDGEACDGLLYADAPRLESICAAMSDDDITWTYDNMRLACTNTCKLDAAACVPNRHLVIDEYLVASDADGTPRALAFTVNVYGTPIDLTECSLSILKADGKAFYSSYIASDGTPQYAYTLYNLAALDTSRIQPTPPCSPLTLCSVPMDTEADYNTYRTAFADKCDAFLSLPTSETALHGDFMIAQRKSIHRLQLSCGGRYIDFVDFAGLNDAIDKGQIHGVRKTPIPWSSSTTVVHANLFTTDATFDASSFAQSPLCD